MNHRGCTAALSDPRRAGLQIDKHKIYEDEWMFWSLPGKMFQLRGMNSRLCWTPHGGDEVGCRFTYYRGFVSSLGGCGLALDDDDDFQKMCNFRGLCRRTIVLLMTSPLQPPASPWVNDVVWFTDRFGPARVRQTNHLRGCSRTLRWGLCRSNQESNKETDTTPWWLMMADNKTVRDVREKLKVSRGEKGVNF